MRRSDRLWHKVCVQRPSSHRRTGRVSTLVRFTSARSRHGSLLGFTLGERDRLGAHPEIPAKRLHSIGHGTTRSASTSTASRDTATAAYLPAAPGFCPRRFSSTCRMRSSRVWRARSTRSLPPPRPDTRDCARTRDSMDLYFQGLAWANRGPSPDNFAKARSFYDRALTADPDNVDALIGSAWADLMAGVMGETPTTAFAIAEAKVTKALSSAPDHANGHRLLRHVEILSERAAQGIAECEHALELDRNLAAAHSTIGLAKIFIGRPEETETHILEALRLSPRDTNAYSWIYIVGFAKLYLGSYEQAVAWCRRAIEANRDYPLTYVSLAAALAPFATRSAGRGAFRSQGRPRARPCLRYPSRPR